MSKTIGVAGLTEKAAEYINGYWLLYR